MKTEFGTLLNQEDTSILQTLKSQSPVLITVEGNPVAYMLDVESYENLQNRLTLLEGIVRGEQAILDSKVLTHFEAKKKMVKW